MENLYKALTTEGLKKIIDDLQYTNMEDETIENIHTYPLLPEDMLTPFFYTTEEIGSFKRIDLPSDVKEAE